VDEKYSAVPERLLVQNDWLRAIDTQGATFASQSPTSSLCSQCYHSVKVRPRGYISSKN